MEGLACPPVFPGPARALPARARGSRPRAHPWPGARARHLAALLRPGAGAALRRRRAVFALFVLVGRSQKLLKKVKSQADKADVQAPTHQENERTKLMAIVSKYDMSAADIDALIKWRHADDH